MLDHIQNYVVKIQHNNLPLSQDNTTCITERHTGSVENNILKKIVEICKIREE